MCFHGARVCSLFYQILEGGVGSQFERVHAKWNMAFKGGVLVIIKFVRLQTLSFSY